MINATRCASVDTLKSLYRECFAADPESVKLIAGAGSERTYYRLSGSLATVIGTIGTNLQENLAFIALSRHLAALNLPVPKVVNVSADSMCYLQQDLGNFSLMDAIKAGRTSHGFDESALADLRHSAQMLAQVQTLGAQGLDWSVCFPSPSMDENMVRWDLSYFKYDFLKLTGVEFSEVRLQAEFDKLTAMIMQCCHTADTLMIRDFQSRNIMLVDNATPYLIDFQGARRGPRQYDVASFLWQAKAQLSPDVRRRLIDVFCEATKQYSPDFDEEQFRDTLPMFVLLRQLQTLGAYGFRGWCQGKAHFLQSVAPGVDNWVELMMNPEIGRSFPYLKVLSFLVADSHAVRQARFLADSTVGKEGLTVAIQSFSYKKGIPADLSGNGGGFVFDCRAIHNPGRYEQYKQLTGMDESVSRFLEDDGEVFGFLDSVYRLVDSSIERYLKRGFNNLSIGFGCTGGQHRSVYCAQALAKHIKEKYPTVNVVTYHREQQKV